MKGEDLEKLKGNDIMVRWMCNVELKDRKSSDELKDCLGLVRIKNCIQRFRHVETRTKTGG